MDITIVGMIKNSADVIETFIRANGLFADRFVLINNHSTDNTMTILSKLQDEGYEIEIYSDDENAYLQSMKMNILIRNVIAKYETNWIIPLDDDEILISKSGFSVRKVISDLDINRAYFAKWRIYIPTENDDMNEICVAKRQRYQFSDSLVNEKKVLFSNITASSEMFRIVQGNHDFVGVNVEKEYHDDLVIAHFPVRSEEQIISKAIVGWTNYLAMPNNREGNGGHWKVIYDYYKKHFTISIDMMWQISMLYLKSNISIDELNVESNPLDLDDSAYEIRYTRIDEINPIINYINNCEQLADNYSKILEKNDFKADR